MKRVIAAAVSLVLAGALGACGKTQESAGSAGGTDTETGQVRLNLNGNMTVGDTMAYIVIQNLFDSSQSFLIDCGEKSHQLDGATFCDELVVLPPGVYEIIVQSTDPNCRAEQEFYKVIVKPAVTVEVEINLVCGGATGGLDLLIKKTEPPVFQDIKFNIGDDQANKFVCQYGDDVTVTAWVTDSDTDCANITGLWYADGVLVPNVAPFPPPIGSAPTTGIDPETGACLFSVTIDADAPIDLYDLKLVVNDGKYSASLTFPIHLVSCGNTADAGVP